MNSEARLSPGIHGTIFILLWIFAALINLGGGEMVSQNVNAAVQIVAGDNAPDAIEKIAAPFDMPQLDRPRFPERTFDIRDYGASGDGKTMNTAAIKRAIDACAAGVGGKVLVPAGKWLTGAIHLKSNVNLHLAAGAELHFSDDPNDYLPVVFTRWAGFEVYNYSPLIYARDCENIAVTGPGKLFGHGESWWKWKHDMATAAHIYRDQVLKGVPPEKRIYGTPEAGLRPQFISPINCKHVLLEGFSIETPGPFWTLDLIYCDRVIIRGLRLQTAGGPNTDGINLDSSRNVLIEYCRVSAGDDCMTMKSGINEDGWRVGRPTENVVIRHVACVEGHTGISIGSEMSGDVRNLLVHDCLFDGTLVGVRLKSNASRGGTVEKIHYQRLRLENIHDEAFLITTNYTGFMANQNGKAFPSFRDITVEDVTCNAAKSAASVTGTEQKPIESLSLKNVTIKAQRGMTFNWVSGLRLANVACEISQGESFTFKNCQEVERIPLTE